MRARYVKLLLRKELLKIERELNRSFSRGDDKAMLRLFALFSEKLKEYHDYINSNKN